MKNVAARLTRLESQKPEDRYRDWTDEQLEARFAEVAAQLIAAGCTPEELTLEALRRTVGQ